jgi:endonuclease/exonuclease/phosphatase family metal-dependent hydrolase
MPVAVDTFRILHPAATDVGTFNGFRGTTTGQKIDFILTSPGWQVRDAQIVRFQREGRYPSDHFPVTARLQLPAPAADATASSRRASAAPAPPTRP